MTGQEKLLAAFSRAGTPEFGSVITYYTGIYSRDHWDRLTDKPWWALQSGDLALHRAVHGDFIRNTGQDWFRLPMGPSRADRKNVVIEQRRGKVFRVDRRTGERKELQRPSVGGWHSGISHSVDPEKPPRTPEDIDKRIELQTQAQLSRPFRNGAIELTEQLKADEARDLFRIGGVGSPFWLCYTIWGFDGMMRLISDHPDLIHYACRRRLKQCVAAVEQQARMGFHGIWIEECMTDMVSPAAFREFNLPYLRELTDAIRRHGMHSIYYYCGNPNDRMELLLESGADALSLEESKKGWDVDIAKVADYVRGRVVVLGNLDAITLLESGTEAQLRAEIARQMAAGRRNGSRFILSLGSPVTPGTTVERVRRYCDLARELGRV